MAYPSRVAERPAQKARRTQAQTGDRLRGGVAGVGPGSGGVNEPAGPAAVCGASPGGPGGFPRAWGTMMAFPHLHRLTRPAHSSGAESKQLQKGQLKRIIG